MDVVEEIKQRVDIVELVSHYVPHLKKSGQNFRALCPFHREKTPSFFVHPERQIFHCFGCSKGGDAFTFLQEIERLTFPEALKLLAERAGVELPRSSKPGEEAERSLKTRLLEIHRRTTKLYHEILVRHPRAQEARNYLAKRGLTPQTIAKFQIGYAPDASILEKTLTKRGVSHDDLITSGLLIRATDGSLFDRFRDRIIFPILDVLGNPIAFSGRLLHEREGVGKYINSPDTPLFQKGRVLYGLAFAKQAIRQAGSALVVEGQMDLVTCHQAGIEYAIATSGSALTTDHLTILRRYTDTLLFAFDQDAAGQEATKRAIALAHEAGFFVRIVLLPLGEDPASLITKDPALFKKELAEPVGALDFYIKVALSRHRQPLDAQAKRAIAKEVLPALKSLADPVVQAHYLAHLARLIAVSEEALHTALAKVRQTPPIAPQPQAPAARRFSLSEELFARLLAFPELAGEVLPKLSRDDFEESQEKELFQTALSLYNQKKHLELSKLGQALPKLRSNLEVLAARGEILGRDLASRELREIRDRLLSHRRSRLRGDFARRIREAEQAGRKDEVKALVRKFQALVIRGGSDAPSQTNPRNQKGETHLPG